MPRMRILSQAAQEAFDQPPQFDFKGRKRAFDLPMLLIDQARGLKNPINQIGFLVQAAYFKQTKRFFLAHSYHERVLAAAARILNLCEDAFAAQGYAKATKLRHQQAILDFYGFRSFDATTAMAIGAEVATMARQHLKPRLIFDRCVDFLIQQKFQAPRASTLIKLIRTCLQSRQRELVAVMESTLSDNVRAQLDALFTIENHNNRYRLTLLKSISGSSKPTQIRESVADFQTVAELFGILAPTMDALSLGSAGIRYFAQGVLKSEIFQIQWRSDGDRYLHAAAFISHQFYRLGDTLVDQLLSAMASFQTTVARQHKEWLFEQRKEQGAQLRALLEGLDRSVFAFRKGVQALTDNPDLSDHEKVQQIRGLLTQTAPPDVQQLKKDLAEGSEEGRFYDLLERQSLRLQNRINPILKALDFDSNGRVSALAMAIDLFKKGKDTPCLDFLLDQERTAVTREDGSVRPSLYKVFLFQHVAGAIKAGNLNLPHSYKYRAMDSYLINPLRWHQQREQLIERAGLRAFADPAPLFATLKTALDEQYECTNTRAPDNPYLRFRKDGQYVLDTPASEECYPRSKSDPPCGVKMTHLLRRFSQFRGDAIVNRI